MPVNYPSVLGEHYFRHFKTQYITSFHYKHFKMAKNIILAKSETKIPKMEGIEILNFHNIQCKMASNIILAKWKE